MSNWHTRDERRLSFVMNFPSSLTEKLLGPRIHRKFTFQIRERNNKTLPSFCTYIKHAIGSIVIYTLATPNPANYFLSQGCKSWGWPCCYTILSRMLPVKLILGCWSWTESKWIIGGCPLCVLSRTMDINASLSRMLRTRWYVREYWKIHDLWSHRVLKSPIGFLACKYFKSTFSF